MSNAHDQHVIPQAGRKHEAAPDCWCAPRVIADVAKLKLARNPNGQVWLHTFRELA